MGWQRPVQVLAIKESVRRRDGNRCVVCQIDEQTHEKRYGQILDVHRVVPGSDYSSAWGVCVTLCKVCHDALHGNGHWGWIAKDDPVDDEQLEAWVRRSSNQDESDEQSWRKLEPWGAWVRELCWAKVRSMFPKPKPGARIRRRKRVSPLRRFSWLSGLSEKRLLAFHAGREHPFLFEAKMLAAALNITLDELATQPDPDEGWRTLCEERSRLRALVLRAREPEDGELEALSPAARMVWEIVRKADEKRAEMRERVRKAEEKYLREMHAKQQPVILGRTVS
jgi:hypothetical protein